MAASVRQLVLGWSWMTSRNGDKWETAGVALTERAAWRKVHRRIPPGELVYGELVYGARQSGQVWTKTRRLPPERSGPALLPEQADVGFQLVDAAFQPGDALVNLDLFADVVRDDEGGDGDHGQDQQHEQGDGDGSGSQDS